MLDCTRLPTFTKVAKTNWPAEPFMYLTEHETPNKDDMQRIRPTDWVSEVMIDNPDK
jgi:hypothetical protein